MPAIVTREDLDAGRVDLPDVVDRAAEPLAPVSPGEILRDEFLDPLRLNASAVAAAIGVPRNRLTEIIKWQACDHGRHRFAPQHLLRDLAGVLAKPPGQLRPGADQT